MTYSERPIIYDLSTDSDLSGTYFISAYGYDTSYYSIRVYLTYYNSNGDSQSTFIHLI